MNSDMLVSRYRTFLLFVSGISSTFAVVELWFEEHTGGPIQMIPFVLCALCVASIAVALVRPGRRALKALRIVMGVTLFGSLFGLYEHFEHNWEFAREIRPNASFSVMFIDTLHGGNPLLAPGILALAAVLAIAATYFHPALQPQSTKV